MLLTESAEVAEGLDLTLFRSPGCTVPRRLVFVVLSMGLALCHPSGV